MNGCFRGNKKALDEGLCENMVPKVGVEPTRAIAHCALNAARLPIPPLRRIEVHHYTTILLGACQQFTTGLSVVFDGIRPR